LVNDRELFIKRKYEKDGWTPISHGAPDFLMLKFEGSEIKDIEFVEVKSPKDELTRSQKMWQEALKKLGADFKVKKVREIHDYEADGTKGDLIRKIIEEKSEETTYKEVKSDFEERTGMEVSLTRIKQIALEMDGESIRIEHEINERGNAVSKIKPLT